MYAHFFSECLVVPKYVTNDFAITMYWKSGKKIVSGEELMKALVSYDMYDVNVLLIVLL